MELKAAVPQACVGAAPAHPSCCGAGSSTAWSECLQSRGLWQGSPICSALHGEAIAACHALVMVPWQGNRRGRTKPLQRQDGAGGETERVASKLCWKCLVLAQQPSISGGYQGAGPVAGWLVGITADVSSAQGSRARTVRRTSMTVQATTARMGVPAWTVSTPTTASARLSGQVTVLSALGVARAGLGTDPVPGDAGDCVGRTVPFTAMLTEPAGASRRCPVPYRSVLHRGCGRVPADAQRLPERGHLPQQPWRLQLRMCQWLDGRGLQREHR